MPTESPGELGDMSHLARTLRLMSHPFRRDRPPQYFADLRRDLKEFRAAYVNYINATAEMAYAGRPVPRDARRSEVMKKAVRAHRAVGESGMTLAWLPPPVYANSTPPLRGLASVAFAHENEAYRGFGSLDIPKPYEATLDAVDQAETILEVREDDARKRRRRPLYWIDRSLRGVLGLPAYLVSTVFGFDLSDLPDGRANALWWFSVAADSAGIFGLGRSLGWW